MTMQTGAFVPRGNTIAISAPTAAPPVGVQAPVFSGDQAQSQMVFRLRNPSLSNDAYFGYGGTAAEAQTNAAAPPAKCVTVGPGQVEYIEANAGTYWSALAVGATISVHVTPGDIA